MKRYKRYFSEANDFNSDVALSIGTPAAKLVSFSINSYYNIVKYSDIADLAKEFENNPVALFIFKARVKSYIYNNHLDKREVQRIVDLLKMEIKPSIPQKMDTN